MEEIEIVVTPYFTWLKMRILYWNHPDTFCFHRRKNCKTVNFRWEKTKEREGGGREREKVRERLKWLFKQSLQRTGRADDAEDKENAKTCAVVAFGEQTTVVRIIPRLSKLPAVDKKKTATHSSSNVFTFGTLL